MTQPDDQRETPNDPQQALMKKLIWRIENSTARNTAIMARQDFRNDYDAIPAPMRCSVLRAMALRERG